MALVPRLLEARGLDVSPAIRDKLRHAGDDTAADIVAIILRDEIGHVAIGNRWFQYLCAGLASEPDAVFETLLIQLKVAAPRPPFNLEARKAAGFAEHEIAHMVALNERTKSGAL
jgi:uncharacterized ferritin-like protein (DUF455 family)